MSTEISDEGYGGLNEHNPHILEYWCPVGGSIWKGFGGVVFLEEVCHWGERGIFQVSTDSHHCQ